MLNRMRRAKKITGAHCYGKMPTDTGLFHHKDRFAR
jgi:hypothetical protein